jgi:hypothetical protein
MRGSILNSNKIFFSSPKRRDKLWGPLRLVGVERASAEVKNEWSYISTPYTPSCRGEGQLYSLLFKNIILGNVSTPHDDAGTWVSLASFLVPVCNIRPHLNHVIQ